MYPPLTDPDARALLAAIAETPDDDTPRLALADWLEERGDDRAPWVRNQQLWSRMAPDAHDPVPALLNGLGSDDDTVSREARHLLATIGSPVIPAVRAWLRGRALERWWQVVHDVLLPSPPPGLRPVPDLITALNAGGEHSLWEAFIDLGFHGPAAAPAVDWDHLQHRAWQSFQALDPGLHFLMGWEVVDEVEARRRDQLVMRCRCQLTILQRLNPSETRYLIRALREKARWWRDEAIDIIGRMGSQASDAVPALIELLNNSLPCEVNDATVPVANVLPKLGEAARAAVPALEAALDRYPGDAPTRQAILAALAALRQG